LQILTHIIIYCNIIIAYLFIINALFSYVKEIISKKAKVCTQKCRYNDMGIEYFMDEGILSGMQRREGFATYV